MRFLPLLFVYIGIALAGTLEVRQTANDQTLLGIDCGKYSRIANLSTISRNSTYRAAFLQATTDGSTRASKILNTAQAQNLALVENVSLNQQCGNSTAIAIQEAETNFTNGIIFSFKVQPSPGVAPSGDEGLITLFTVMGIVILMCTTFGAL